MPRPYYKHRLQRFDDEDDSAWSIGKQKFIFVLIVVAVLFALCLVLCIWICYKHFNSGNNKQNEEDRDKDRDEDRRRDRGRRDRHRKSRYEPRLRSSRYRRHHRDDFETTGTADDRSVSVSRARYSRLDDYTTRRSRSRADDRRSPRSREWRHRTSHERRRRHSVEDRKYSSDHRHRSSDCRRSSRYLHESKNRNHHSSVGHRHSSSKEDRETQQRSLGHRLSSRHDHRYKSQDEKYRPTGDRHRHRSSKERHRSVDEIHRTRSRGYDKDSKIVKAAIEYSRTYGALGASHRKASKDGQLRQLSKTSRPSHKAKRRSSDASKELPTVNVEPMSEDKARPDLKSASKASKARPASPSAGHQPSVASADQGRQTHLLHQPLTPKVQTAPSPLSTLNTSQFAPPSRQGGAGPLAMSAISSSPSQQSSTVEESDVSMATPTTWGTAPGARGKTVPGTTATTTARRPESPPLSAILTTMTFPSIQSNPQSSPGGMAFHGGAPIPKPTASMTPNPQREETSEESSSESSTQPQLLGQPALGQAPQGPPPQGLQAPSHPYYYTQANGYPPGPTPPGTMPFVPHGPQRPQTQPIPFVPGKQGASYTMAPLKQQLLEESSEESETTTSTSTTNG